MNTPRKQVLMRFPEDTYAKLKLIAAVNKRTITNQVEVLIDNLINDYEFKYGKIPLIENNIGINNGTINNVSTLNR